MIGRQPSMIPQQQPPEPLSPSPTPPLRRHTKAPSRGHRLYGRQAIVPCTGRVEARYFFVSLRWEGCIVWCGPTLEVLPVLTLRACRACCFCCFFQQEGGGKCHHRNKRAQDVVQAYGNVKTDDHPTDVDALCFIAATFLIGVHCCKGTANGVPRPLGFCWPPDSERRRAPRPV